MQTYDLRYCYQCWFIWW